MACCFHGSKCNNKTRSATNMSHHTSSSFYFLVLDPKLYHYGHYKPMCTVYEQYKYSINCMPIYCVCYCTAVILRLCKFSYFPFLVGSVLLSYKLLRFYRTLTFTPYLYTLLCILCILPYLYTLLYVMYI